MLADCGTGLNTLSEKVHNSISSHLVRSVEQKLFHIEKNVGDFTRHFTATTASDTASCMVPTSVIALVEECLLRSETSQNVKEI